MKPTFAMVVALACLQVAPARGQVTGHLDVGVGSSSGRGAAGSSLWAVAPSIRWRTANFRFDGSGDYRGLGPSGHALSATGSAAYFIHLPASLLIDLNGTGAARDATGLTTASVWDGGLRMHLRSSVTGAWFGVRGGRDRFGGLDGWEAGLWRDLGPLSIQIQGRQTSGNLAGGNTTSVRDSIVRVDSAQSRVRLTTELGGWVGYGSGRWQLRSGAGWRHTRAEPARSNILADGGGATTRSSDGWWTAEASFWLTERLGISGSVGREAPNPSLLLAAGNFLRLSVRVGLDRHPTGDASKPEVASLVVRRSGAVATLELAAPAALRVEIMSDLTDWQPADLAHASNGRWRIRLPAAAGIHYINVRYDGGRWQTPPSLKAVADEFGQETGVMLIE